MHDIPFEINNYIYIFFLVLYKAVCLSVCLSVRLYHAANSVVSAWINSGIGLSDSCVLWHKQVCFYESVSALCWPHECLKGTAVASFCRA